MITARGANLPKVSALMGAYNYGPYIVEAVESAMRQDYPAELLELVIVDDGSTDDTAALVAGCMDRYPGRIKFIQQENAGATAATNRARREASGDLIALLDADDVWLPEKTLRQVELMLARPELGMTFTRMRLINGEGAAFHSGYGHREPMSGNQFARVLWENVAVQSSLIIEADLFDEIPAQAPYADWWLCLRAAQFKRIDYLTDDLVLYRWHGANITGGVGGFKALREAQKGIGFQRWVIRSFDLEDLASRLGPEDMSFVWTGLENQAKKGLSGLGSHFGVLTTVTEEDRSEAAVNHQAAISARERGDLDAAALLLLRACACDPFDHELRGSFQAVATEAADAAKLPDPMAEVDGFAVLTDLAFLLEDDRRLRRYAETMRSAPAATLVIDASAEVPATAAEQLQALVARCGLGDDDSVAIVGLVGELQPSQRARVRRGIHAVYADSGVAAMLTAFDLTEGTPAFTLETLTRLRDLAAEAS